MMTPQEIEKIYSGFNEKDNIYTNALPPLAEGIRKAHDIVAPTLGAKGSNVVLQAKLPPYAITTNDGATIIKAIELSDPIEAMGLGFLKEAVERSNGNSGDGSTSTCVILNAIVQEGLKSGKTGLEIKESLDECLPIILKAIDGQTKEITVEDIPAVARIAGESEELARTLGDIYKTIGQNGIVHLQGSGTYETSFSLIEGVRFGGTGFLSPFMATEKNKAVYEKPAILVTKRKIERISEIEPLLGALMAQNTKTLVIFADDMDSNVARALIELQKNDKRQINILIIKAPIFWKGYVFEDFAKVTGATIVEDTSGVTFKNLRLDHLGTCDTIITDKEETIVIGIKDISEHIESIKDDESLPSDDKKVRLTYLSTKTAILKLGAKSETELTYLRLKAEDAIHSSRLALQGGIVAGGGVALMNVSYEMPDTIGGRILRTALTSPILQITKNAGNDNFVIGTERAPDGFHDGYNAKTGQMVNMIDAGIIDAAIVVKRAVQNALGIASTLLTISSAITLSPEPEIKNNNPFA